VFFFYHKSGLIFKNIILLKYLGIWYEIERYDQPFQISTDCVTALYGLFNNGLIRVTNQGRFLDNNTKTAAEGLAALSFPRFVPLIGELRVSFNNRKNF
jgi:apolipoprotein D and lipocalin family protein